MGRRDASGVKESGEELIGGEEEDCQTHVKHLREERGEVEAERGEAQSREAERGEREAERGEVEAERGDVNEEKSERREKNGEETETTREDFDDPMENKMSQDQCYICPRLASITCPGCQLMACCSTHLSLHRPATSCLPWNIDRLPVVGRVLVAARDIAPYELILRDSPLVIVPKKRSTSASDDGKCEMCEEDKDIYDELDSKGLLPLDGKLSVEQLLAYRRLKNLEEDKASLVLGLMDHKEEREEKVDFVEKEEELASFIRSLEESCSREEAGRLLGVVDTNSLEIMGGRSGVFPALSLLSHSCTPTLEHWVEGEVVVVRARHAIKKGEELTIRYSHLSMHRSLLRPLINEAWHFTCNCPRCKDGSELGTFASCPRCPSSECLALLQPPQDALNIQNLNHLSVAEDPSATQSNHSSTTSWNCLSCGASATEEEVLGQASSITTATLFVASKVILLLLVLMILM